MDDWVDPRQPYRGRKSLYREQYNALGKCNLAAIERVVTSKYERGPAFNRQYSFVDILLSDIIESEETLDTSELVRETQPPSFQLMSRSDRRRASWKKTYVLSAVAMKAMYFLAQGRMRQPKLARSAGHSGTDPKIARDSVSII